MSIYFLQLRDGAMETLDSRGTEIATLDDLTKVVLKSVRNQISVDARDGVIDFRFRMDAEDECGTIVYSLPFRHAVNVIPEAVMSDPGYAYSRLSH